MRKRLNKILTLNIHYYVFVFFFFQVITHSGVATGEPQVSSTGSYSISGILGLQPAGAGAGAAVVTSGAEHAAHHRRKRHDDNGWVNFCT